jgi:hypothetical protein
MHKIIKTNEKSKLDLGYKLHARRLSYTGKEAVRTIKYPLTGDTNLYNFICSAVESDSINLLGPLNIDEYLNTKFENNYSVLNFLIDTIRLGFVFQPSTSELVYLIENYEYGKSKMTEIVESIQDKNLLEKIELKLFIELLLVDEFRSTSTLKSLSKRFINIFKKEFQKDPELISRCQFIAGELLKLNGKDQKIFLEKEFKEC